MKCKGKPIAWYFQEIRSSHQNGQEAVGKSQLPTWNVDGTPTWNADGMPRDTAAILRA